jgi:hypothetical protein
MINSTTSTNRAVHADAISAPGQATVKQLSPRPDQLSTASASFLRAELSRQPEIRPEVVERARALASDATYPSPAILKQVGALILNSADLSEDQS